MLINKTGKKAIIEKVRLAETPAQRARGLMFRRKSSFDYALVFRLPRGSRIAASIHMMFVFFPIDVVYLDRAQKVVDVARGLRPFALNYTPKKPAKYFIELPAGKASGISEGDEIAW